MSCCCQNQTTTRLRVHRLASGVGWVVATVMLAAVPKCPVCLAAYVALWTGIGLSLSTASYLRAAMLLAAGGALLFLAIREGRRLVRRLANSIQSRDTT